MAENRPRVCASENMNSLWRIGDRRVLRPVGCDSEGRGAVEGPRLLAWVEETEPSTRRRWRGWSATTGW